MLLALVMACAPGLDLHPLGSSAVDVFRDFEEAPEALPAVLAAIDDELDGFDLTARRRKNQLALPELTIEMLGGAEVPEGIDTSSQIRVGLPALSEHSLDDNLLVQVEENQTCVNADAVKCHARRPVEGSDVAAFLDGTDEIYRTTNTLRIQTLPVDFWIEVPVDFRWVTLDDGRRAVVSRTWMAETFDNDNGRHTWKQRFGVDVFIEDEDPGRTRRFYGTWVGPARDGIVGAITDNVVRRGLRDGFDRPEKWLASDDRGCRVELSECLDEAPF